MLWVVGKILASRGKHHCISLQYKLFALIKSSFEISIRCAQGLIEWVNEDKKQMNDPLRP